MVDQSDVAYLPPPAAEKYRRAARVRDLTDAERRAYGNAVLDGIRSMHRQQINRETSIPRVRCASGTMHSGGHEILASIKRSHASALEAASKGPTKRRTPAQLKAAYEAAMREKALTP